MRILFLTHYDNMYGANRALFKLVELLKKEHEMEPIVVVPVEGELTRRLQELGVECIVHSVTQWQAVYSSAVRFFVKKLMRRRILEKEIDSLYELVKNREIDLVYSNSSVIGTGAFLAKRLRCRHIWHIREFSKEHFHMKYFYSSGKVKELYEKADCLITISDALKDNYQRKYPKAKIERIYDGVSGEYERKEAGEAKEIFRFVYVGYLFPMKHQEQVLEACHHLAESEITNFEMYFIGSGQGEYEKVLRKRLEGWKLPQVKMAGYVKDVHELLNEMDVGIIASEYEGFGLVTVEYMLHGMPVIGRNSGGTPEIIQDGVTGFLYHTVEELTNCMRQMMAKPLLINTMGEAGKARAKQFFTEEANANAIAELLNHSGKE